MRKNTHENRLVNIATNLALHVIMSLGLVLYAPESMAQRYMNRSFAEDIRRSNPI